jgi:hypothetical protein
MAAKGQFKKNPTKRTKLQRAYDGSEEVKRKRAQRNKARRAALASGTVHKGDGKDVHHKDGNTAHGGKNLAVISRTKNRAMGGKVGNRAGKARGGRKGGSR